MLTPELNPSRRESLTYPESRSSINSYATIGASVTLTYPMTVATDLRALSVQDYHRMVETVILAADERVDLIAGRLNTLSDVYACFGNQRQKGMGWIRSSMSKTPLHLWYFSIASLQCVFL